MPRCSRGSTRSRSSGRSSTPWSRPGRATGPRSRTTRPDPGARLPRTSSSAATGGPGGGIESSVEPGRRYPGAGPASGASVAAALASIREIEREVAALRTAPGSDAPYQRTSVMTHTAWVPEEWAEAVEDVLSGLAERHPSRTIVLFPRTDEEDGIEADVEVDAFPVGEGHCEGLVDVVERLIVDSNEWPGLPDPYRARADLFERVIVSDISWARTSRWRAQLATLWPDIAGLQRVRVAGTEAQAHLLAGWLRSRLQRPVELEHEPADRLEGVEIDGEPAPFPPGDAPSAVDLLSEELDRFGRDRIYEEAVRAALV